MNNISIPCPDAADPFLAYAMRGDRPVHGFDLGVGVGKTAAAISVIKANKERVKDAVHQIGEFIAQTTDGSEERERLEENRIDLKRLGRATFAVPTHRLGDELVRRIEAEGLSAGVWRGRLADDPGKQGEKMCLIPKEVEKVVKSGLPVEDSMCRSFRDGEKRECEHHAVCPYQKQKGALFSKDVAVVPHASLFHQMPKINTRGTLFIDEGFWQASLKTDAGGMGEILSLGNFRKAPVESFKPTFENRPSEDDLQWMRGMISEALTDHPPGNIERCRIAGVLDDLSRYDEALASEWKTLSTPDIWPGMPQAALRIGLKEARKNKELFLRIELWEALKTLVADAGAVSSGWVIRAEDDEGNPAVVLRKRENIKRGWADGAVVVLDATLSPELVQPYFTRPLLVSASEGVISEFVRVLQVVDKSFSASGLIPKDGPSEKENKRRRNRAREVWRWIGLRALEFHGMGKGGLDVLVICQLGLENLLKEMGLPENVGITHFNAIRGLDRWGGVRCLVVIGRTIPSPSVVEEIAETITGRGVEKSVIDTDDCVNWYMQETVNFRLSDGSGWPVANDRHPDATAEAVRHQICEAELIQAIGRGRGINRTADNPLQVDVLTNVCLPLIVDEPVRWADVVPGKIEEMVCLGLLPGSFEVAAKLYPDLWPSPDAARKASKREQTPKTSTPDIPLLIYSIWGKSGFDAPSPGTNVPGLCQIPGTGRRATVFPFAYFPALIPDLQAWLEARLGLVDWVLTGEEAETEFLKRQKAAERKKRKQ